MEVDTNELLRRIGAVLRVISDKMNLLIEIGERVEREVRLPSEEESKTVADVLINDACIPSDAVADEPPKKWRILHPGESVRSGDWENADLNSESDPPNGLGWRPAIWKIGLSVLKDEKVIFARLVADEPPKKWRILEPGEVVQEGDCVNALFHKPDEDPPGGGWIPVRASLIGREASQAVGLYFARLVADEPAKEPVDHSAGPRAVPRISPGEWLDIRDAYRDATPADVGKLVYVRNGEIEPWIELRLAEVTGAALPFKCTRDGLDPNKWQAFRYAVIRNEGPAWEPKVGDWVLVTRPKTPEVSDDTLWLSEMDQFDGAVMQVEQFIESYQSAAVVLAGYAFRLEWLAPATTSQPLKIPPSLATVSGSGVRESRPAEPQYRIPSLPADAGKECEFSDDGKTWVILNLDGWLPALKWVSKGEGCWDHARIKKDA
jgi:hypothetical protein